MPAGASSNGAGKTALAMASSWAITGDMGPWADAVGKRANLTKSSLVNSSPDVKRASLSGVVNDQTFTLTRGVDERGKGVQHAQAACTRRTVPRHRLQQMLAVQNGLRSGPCDLHGIGMAG